MPSILHTLVIGTGLMIEPLHPGQGLPVRPFGYGTAEGSGICTVPGLERGRSIPAEILVKARDAPNLVRIVNVRDTITMDFQPNRLTIVVDDQGRIVSSRCG